MRKISLTSLIHFVVLFHELIKHIVINPIFQGRHYFEAVKKKQILFFESSLCRPFFLCRRFFLFCGQSLRVVSLCFQFSRSNRSRAWATPPCSNGMFPMNRYLGALLINRFAGLARMVIYRDSIPDCHELILRSASLDCDGGHLWQGRGAELETENAQDCQSRD